jgi:hypothetical protein
MRRHVVRQVILVLDGSSRQQHAAGSFESTHILFLGSGCTVRGDRSEVCQTWAVLSQPFLQAYKNERGRLGVAR